MDTTQWTYTDPDEQRIRSELRATLAAYQELGPSYEDQVINSFVDRIRPVLRNRQVIPRRPDRRRDRPHYGLLIALALLFGWFVLMSSAVHTHADWWERRALPGDQPSIVAPVLPQQPQLPAIVPLQPGPAQAPQQAPGSSVQ